MGYIDPADAKRIAKKIEEITGMEVKNPYSICFPSTIPSPRYDNRNLVESSKDIEHLTINPELHQKLMKYTIPPREAAYRRGMKKLRELGIIPDGYVDYFPPGESQPLFAPLREDYRFTERASIIREKIKKIL